MMKTTETISVFSEIRELIDFKDFGQATKRLIDLTLDTEKLSFYKETNAFLNWLDLKPAADEVSEKLYTLLEKLQT